MLRFFFSLLISVTMAKWIYAEIGLIAPSALPAIDMVVNSVEIPTHDKWPKDSLNQILVAVESLTKTAVAAADTGRSQVARDSIRLDDTRRLASGLSELEGALGVVSIDSLRSSKKQS